MGFQKLIDAYKERQEQTSQQSSSSSQQTSSSSSGSSSQRSALAEKLAGTTIKPSAALTNAKQQLTGGINKKTVDKAKLTGGNKRWHPGQRAEDAHDYGGTDFSVEQKDSELAKASGGKNKGSAAAHKGAENLAEATEQIAQQAGLDNRLYGNAVSYLNTGEWRDDYLEKPENIDKVKAVLDNAYKKGRAAGIAVKDGQISVVYDDLDSPGWYTPNKKDKLSVKQANDLNYTNETRIYKEIMDMMQDPERDPLNFEYLRAYRPWVDLFLKNETDAHNLEIWQHVSDIFDEQFNMSMQYEWTARVEAIVSNPNSTEDDYRYAVDAFKRMADQYATNSYFDYNYQDAVKWAYQQWLGVLYQDVEDKKYTWDTAQKNWENYEMNADLSFVPSAEDVKAGTDLNNAVKAAEEAYNAAAALVSSIEDEYYLYFEPDEIRAIRESLENYYGSRHFTSRAQGELEIKGKNEAQAIVDNFRANELGLSPKYFNTPDRLIAGMEAGVEGLKKGWAGAAGIGMHFITDQIAEGNNALASAYGFTDVDFTHMVTEEERSAIAKQAEEAEWYDVMRGEGAYEEEFGPTVRDQHNHQEEIDQLTSQIETLEAEEQAIWDKAGGEYSKLSDADKDRIEEITEELDTLGKERDPLVADQEKYSGKVSKPIMDLYNIAARSSQKQQALFAKAMKDAGKWERRGVQAAANFVQMAADTAGNLVVPGSSLWLLGVRVFGEEGFDALMNGATLNEAVGKATYDMAKEMLSEEIFGFFDKWAYGKGLITKSAIDDIISALDMPDWLALVVTGAVESGGEGLEEVLSNWMSPLGDMIVSDKSFAELWEEDTANTFEDFLIGSFMGFTGFSGQAAMQFSAAASEAPKGSKLKAGMGSFTANVRATDAALLIQDAYRQFANDPVNQTLNYAQTGETLEEAPELTKAEQARLEDAQRRAKAREALEQKIYEAEHGVKGRAGYIERYGGTKTAANRAAAEAEISAAEQTEATPATEEAQLEQAKEQPAEDISLETPVEESAPAEEAPAQEASAEEAPAPKEYSNTAKSLITTVERGATPDQLMAAYQADPASVAAAYYEITGQKLGGKGVKNKLKAFATDYKAGKYSQATQGKTEPPSPAETPAEAPAKAPAQTSTPAPKAAASAPKIAEPVSTKAPAQAPVQEQKTAAPVAPAKKAPGAKKAPRKTKTPAKPKAKVKPAKNEVKPGTAPEASAGPAKIVNKPTSEEARSFYSFVDTMKKSADLAASKKAFQQKYFHGDGAYNRAAAIYKELTGEELTKDGWMNRFYEFAQSAGAPLNAPSRRPGYVESEFLEEQQAKVAGEIRGEQEGQEQETLIEEEVPEPGKEIELPPEEPLSSNENVEAEEGYTPPETQELGEQEEAPEEPAKEKTPAKEKPAQEKTATPEVKTAPATEKATTETVDTDATIEEKAREQEEKVKESVRERVKNCQLKMEELNDFMKNKVITPAEVSELLGQKPSKAKSLGEQMKVARRQYGKAREQAVANGLVTELSEADQKTLKQVQDRRANDQKRNEEKKIEDVVEDEKAADKVESALRGWFKKQLQNRFNIAEFIEPKLGSPAETLLNNLAGQLGISAQEVSRIAEETCAEVLNDSDFYGYGATAKLNHVKEYIINNQGTANTVKGLNIEDVGITNLTTEQGDGNVHTERSRGNLRGVLSGEPTDIRKWFMRNARGNRSARADGRKNARTWEQRTKEYTKNGAKILSADEISDADYAFAEAALNGIDGVDTSKISCVTFIDVSGMKDPGTLLGFVDSRAPGAGLFIIVNHPAANSNKVTRGVVVLHEPVHYFIAKWRQRNNGFNPDFDSIIQKLASKAIGGNQSKARVIELANKLINYEVRFSGKAIFDRVGYEVGDKWAQFKAADIVEKYNLVDEWFEKAFGEDAEDKALLFWSETYEELIANLAAGNKALGDGSINMAAVQYWARDVLYSEGIVPKGFFENLDSYAKALDNVQSVPSIAAEVGTNPNLGPTVKGLHEEAEPEPSNNELFRLKDQIKQLQQEKEQLKAELAKTQAPRQSNPVLDVDTNRPTPPPAFREVEEILANREGPEYTPQSAEREDRLFTGERVEVGSMKRESLSDEEANRLARKIADGALKSEKDWEQTKEYLMFLNKNGQVSRTYKFACAMILSEMSNVKNYRIRRKGVHGKDVFAKDWDTFLAEQQFIQDCMENISSEGMSAGRGRADISDTQQVRINARQQIFGNKKPTTFDQNSEEVKFEGIIEDFVDEIESINETDNDAVDHLVQVIKDLSYVRNNSAIFGNGAAGLKVAQWAEDGLLQFIAKSNPKAYSMLRMLALGATNRIATDFAQPHTLNAIHQVRYMNMLSCLATAVSNVGNNTVSILNEATAAEIGRRLMGTYFKELTGEESMGKDYTLSPAAFKENRQAMALAGAVSYLSLYYGLDIDQGKLDLDTGAKFNQNSVVFGSSAVGRFLARYAMLTGLKMQTTDEMQKAWTRQGMQRGINELELSDEQRNIMERNADEFANYRLFHENSLLSDALSKFRKAIDRKVKIGNDTIGYIGLGTLAVPFIKVPTNVAIHVLKGTPVGGIVGLAKVGRGKVKAERMHSRVEAYKLAQNKDINDAVKWNLAQQNLTKDVYKELVRYKESAGGSASFADCCEHLGYAKATEMSQRERANIQQELGRVASNTILTGIGFALRMLGGVRNFDDDDDDVARIGREHGLTGLQVNLSCFFNGPNEEWDYDNDIIVGGSWLEVAAMPIAIGVEIANDVALAWGDDTKSAQEKWMKGLGTVAFSPLTSLEKTFEAFKEIPGVSNIADIWESVENVSMYGMTGSRRMQIANGASQYVANQAASFIIPNSIAQLAAGMDNVNRDVYTTNNPGQTALNIIKNKIPFVRETIPAKLTSEGIPQQYDTSRVMAIINRTLLPGDVHKVTYSDWEKEAVRLARAGFTNVITEASAKYSVTLGGEKFALSGDERRDYNQVVKSTAWETQNALLHNPLYATLTDEMKAQAWRDAKNMAVDVATWFVKGDESDIAKEDYFEAWELKAGDNQHVATFLAAKYRVKELYDKDGNPTDFKAIDAFIRENYGKLSKEHRELLGSSFTRLDDMYKAMTRQGITSKQYYEAYRLWQYWSEWEDSDETASQRARNLAVDIGNIDGLSSEQARYLESQLKIYSHIPANTDTFQKIRYETGLSTEESDRWLDTIQSTDPAKGYSKMPKNQVYMFIRDYVKADGKHLSNSEQWAMFQHYATDSAWEKVSAQREKYPNFADALAHARYWYKNGKNWEERSYTKIYAPAPKKASTKPKLDDSEWQYPTYDDDDLYETPEYDPDGYLYNYEEEY